jgi:hypothetical protein
MQQRFLKGSRRSVICRDRRQIFQTAPPTASNISLRYIEELSEAAVRLSERDKYDYFYSNGVDYERVKAYYDIVSRLNSCVAAAKPYKDSWHLFKSWDVFTVNQGS